MLAMKRSMRALSPTRAERLRLLRALGLGGRMAGDDG
jgi:hypothetical protein